MIDELQDSSNSFVIKKGNNGFDPTSRRLASANIPEIQECFGDYRGSDGSGGTVYWNPRILDSGEDINGNTYRPAFIGLGHEFAHASDANKGYLHRGNYNNNQPLKQLYSTTGSLYDSEYNGLLKSEWRAVYRENLIRKQAGYSYRVYYFYPSMGPRLLTPDNEPINYPIK